MKEKAKRYKWVFILLLVILVLSVIGSYDNPLSRGVAKVVNKPIETVTAFFSSLALATIGLLLIFAGASAVIPVIALVLVVAGLICLGLAAWSWWGSKSKPDNTSLGGLK